MLRALFLALPAFVLIASSTSVYAQVVERPGRPFRGLFGSGPAPDPDRLRQELTLTSSLFGGYDDVLTPAGIGPEETFIHQQAGYTGYADLALQYWRGRGRRLFDVQGRTYGNAYTNLGVNPSFGGNVRLYAQTPMGRRDELQLMQTFSYDPFFAPGLGPLIGGDPGPAPPTLPTEPVSTYGLTERSSLTLRSALTLIHRFNRRQSMTAGYSFMRQKYLDAAGFDNRIHAANASYEWAYSRYASLRTSYGYSYAAFEDELSLERPMIDHSIQMGVRYARDISRTRRITLTGGGGASYVDAVSGTTGQPINYWTPVGYGSFAVDFGQSWVTSLDYRRGLSVLDGISLETFVTDSVAVSLGGYLTRRLGTSISAAYSNGNSGLGGANGRYDSLDFAAQFQFEIRPWWATVVDYNYYDYRLHDVSDLQSGVPSSFDRHAIRVGVTFWLPLYGSSMTPARPGGGGS
jgi:hypothetical protein